MILSLEGCMAVGKTTALRAVAKQLLWLSAEEEDTAGVLREVAARGLDKRVYADYLEIQRLWLRNETARFWRASALGDVLLDYGPAEIEFYTLYYPRSLGLDWNVETPLLRELTALRACPVQRILFLDAQNHVLTARKNADATRERGFFVHTLRRLMPLKRDWFAARGDTDFLDTTRLTPQQTAGAVAAWCRAQRGLRRD